MQPDLKIIETPRLYLRLMEFSDLEALLKIFGDSKVMVSFDTEPFEYEQMTHWIQRNLTHQDAYGYGLFSVVLKSKGILIGDCGLEHIAVGGEMVAELGYDFRRDYWNQGFATEAALAVRDYAFRVLSLISLISLIRVGNQASKCVAEKIGMNLLEEIALNGIHYWKFGIDNKSSMHE